MARLTSKAMATGRNGRSMASIAVPPLFNVGLFSEAL
jgi:hypothetical protein